MATKAEDLQLGTYKYGWHDEGRPVFEPKRGLSEDVVRGISALKDEPKWMLDMRLKAYRHFLARPMPNWGGELSGIDFDNIFYFVRSTEKQATTWDELPPDIKNTYDRLGIPEAEKQRLIAGVAAQYECLRGDVRVYTATRGLVPIKEIEAGERVFALDEDTGEFVVAPVRASAQTDVRQTYEVTVGGRYARTIVATDNHPVLCLVDNRKPGRQRARYGRRWKTVGELTIGDLVAVARDVPDFGSSHELARTELTPEHFPTQTNPDLAWLFGFWIGDGCTRDDDGHRTWRVEFAVPEGDVEVRDEIARVVDEQFGLATKSPDQWRVAVNSRALVDWLAANDLIGVAHTKRIPGWAFGLPTDERLALLGGYVDADGYVSPDGSGNVVSLTSTSTALLDDAMELAAVSGLRPSGPYRFESAHPHDAERTIVGYRCGIGGDVERLDVRDPRRFMRLGARAYRHSDTSAKGATFRAHTTDHLGFAKVTKIAEADVAPVYDIEIDGPHNFVAEGVVVHNSEVVYHKVREDLEAQGVLFLDTDTGLREHEDIFREHFGRIIPPNDNKFAALNTAVWSGGSFIVVPEGVKVDIPLQAYFRINQQNMGQFERTLIIAEPGSYVHYVEGCLPGGELVATADGVYRPIEQIRVGDQMLSHEGLPVSVTAIQARDYRGDLYRFTPVSAGNRFAVTSEHPLLAVRRADVLVERAPRNGSQPEVNSAELRSAEPQWIEAKDVHEGDFLVFPRPRPAPAETVLPIELAKLAGYYLADGSASLTNGHKSLQFSFHIDDDESIDEVRRMCKVLYDAEGSVFYNEDKHEARILVDTPAGYEAMRTHVGRRSHDKRLSPEFFAQDVEFLRALVETYLRRDGNETDRNGNRWMRAHTTSQTWAFQLQAIVARLGTYATMRLVRDGGPAEILGRQVNRHDQYMVQWTENGPSGGRSRRVRDAGDYFLVPVVQRDVEHFEGVVHNLDVRDPDSYLAAGLAVHNCTAPIYSSDSLHSAVVELIAKPGARLRYTTIQNWSNNVYNLVTKRAAAYEDATVEWIDGNIGCLAEGSRVTTPSGPKPIEQLVPGEQVLSFDEGEGALVWRTVRAKRNSGEQAVREVRVGERVLRVTDNHPFFSYRHDPERARKLGRYELAYVRADELSEAIVPITSVDYGEPHKLERPETATTFATGNQYSDAFTATRERPSRLAIDRETDDDVMWLLGLYVGDGSIETAPAANSGHRWGEVVFSVPRDDRARRRLTDVMSRIMPHTTPTERADGVTLTYHSVKFVELLERNGFAGAARAKRLPEWVLGLPESQRLSFVAGYLDSDGCASKGRRGFSIKSVNKALLSDTAQVLTSLGIPARLYTEFDEERTVVAVGNTVTARGAHRLEFRCDARLLKLVSPRLRDAALAQPAPKLEHFRTVGRSTIELPDTVEIREVDVSEPLETVPTWDIEVEGTGNFVSEGFIVHNSKLTMKYPSVYLMGRGAHGEVLSVAFAGDGQHQDAGAKMHHHASDTTSTILSKSVSQGEGRTSYRGQVEIAEGAHRVKNSTICDALLIDETSRSDTYPYMNIAEEDATIAHEASVSKVGEEQLFYLMQRGIDEAEANAMIVRGFIEPIAKELPMEYSVELNRLISLNMAGAVG